MHWQITPVAAIYALAVLISLTTAAYAWRFRRTSRAARLVVFLMLSGAIWTLGYMLGVFNADLLWKKNMIRVEYLGILGSTYFYFLFALAYTSFERWLTRSTVIVVSVLSGLAYLQALTHDLHPFLYQSFGLTTINGLVVSDKTYGIGFYLTTAYGYLLILTGSALLLIDVVRHPRMFHGQAALMVLAALLPLVVNVGHVVGFNPIQPYDASSVAFMVSGVLIMIGMVRFRLLDLVPIAHDLVFRNVKSGVVIVNAEGRVLEMNPAAEQILGRTQPEAAGKNLLEVFPEHKDLINQFRDIPETQAQIVMSTTGRTYDMQLAPLYQRSRAAEMIGRAILLTDITEREQLIAELDAYAHTVAHDLKSPISTMMGYADLLKETLGPSLDDEAEKLLQTIIRSSRKMDSIINSLLLMAQLRRLDEVETSPVDMSAVVSDTLARLEPRIRETRAVVTCPDRWPEGVVSFAPWIEEIWANYIGNALKYGGTPPRLELGASILPGGRAQFWVKDNGRGLTAEEQSRLFSEFSRLARHTGAEGHGLGLSIVRRIANQLGGDVGVESAPGQGSRFFFELPIQPTSQH